jgi:tetratricopeptide (TPR) repeat protein
MPEADGESLEVLTEFESIQLFAERAALVLPSFQLTQENIQAVVDICRKVDGIPLAIELAAARVNILQVEEILEQLQESFALLSNDARTILPRQQTIRGSMDWSCSLLSEAEKSLLHQLSVFAGGWTLDAAQVVSDGDVLGLLGALVKKSLIVVDQEPGRGTRYRFHEMVRQCAYEQLVRSGQEPKVRSLHLKYFVDLAKQAERELRGPALVDWMDRLSMERNNIRAALHWAEKTEVEAGLYLSSRLMRYWESINLPEGERWLKTFIQKPESQNYPRAYAQVLLTYGWLLTWLQKFDEAYKVTDESLALFRRVKDREGEVDALTLLENILQFKDQAEPSREIGRQALALAQSLRDPWREANALYYLGWGYNDQQTRFAYWERAILLYRQVGDHINLANTLGLLGQFQVLAGDIEIGEKNLDEALSHWQSNKKANVWENPKIAKSIIALQHGRYEEAQEILEQVMRSAEESGNRMSFLWTQVRLGHVAYLAGNWVEARRLLSKSVRDFAADSYTVGAVYALEGLAGLSATVGKMEKAARLLGYTDAARERLSDPRPPHEQADVDLSIAACVARMGNEAFSSAYEAGKRMSLDEAVMFAVQED